MGVILALVGRFVVRALWWIVNIVVGVFLSWLIDLTTTRTWPAFRRWMSGR